MRTSFEHVPNQKSQFFDFSILQSNWSSMGHKRGLLEAKIGNGGVLGCWDVGRMSSFSPLLCIETQRNDIQGLKIKKS